MHDKNELCEKITALYPDIGTCGIDVDVDFDAEKKLEPKNETMNAKVEVKEGNTSEDTGIQTDTKSLEEKGILVEADADAIEAALKKHSKKDDNIESFKEADEQTIVDRVLRQKKKGKWSKK